MSFLNFKHLFRMYTLFADSIKKDITIKIYFVFALNIGLNVFLSHFPLFHVKYFGNIEILRAMCVHENQSNFVGTI